MGDDRAYRESLAAAKQGNVPQLLFKCARLLDAKGVERANLRHPAGHPGHALRPAHTALFPHIDLEGTRLTELARRLGVSKQAVGQLVDELEAMGVVERLPDPSDRRAKLVAFTSLGKEGLLSGLAVLAELEEELACAIGRLRMRALGRTLQRLLVALEADPPRGAAAERDSSPRS